MFALDFPPTADILYEYPLLPLIFSDIRNICFCLDLVLFVLFFLAKLVSSLSFWKNVLR